MYMRRKPKSNIIKILIPLVFLGIILYLTFAFLKNHTTTPVNSNHSQANKPEFGVIKVQKQPIELTYEFPARTFPYKVSDVRPQVNGIIVKKMFTEGAFVHKGDKLYQIDPVEKITILAPISGYIGRSLITEGSLVTQNQPEPLATITQLDPMYVDISIPSNQIAEIKNHKNKKLKLFIDGNQYSYTGSLEFSEMFVNKTTGSVVLRTIFKNPKNELLSGMYVTINVVVTAQNEIALPQKIVHHLPNGQKYVWLTNQDGTVSQKIITATQSVQNKWIIDGGIKDGDLILYEGFQKISEGMKIQPKIIEIK